METFVIYTSVILIVTGLYYFKRKRAKQRLNQIQIQGLANVQSIKTIITYSQQHRGLSAALANGDKSAHRRLIELRLLISKESEVLSSGSLKGNERWLAYTDHWSRLLMKADMQTVNNSFDQHTLMIKNLAYLLEDIAEQAHLTKSYLKALPNIGLVWRELVLTTENIGQSRAIGVAASIQKSCSSVDKIRLNFLIQTMQQTTHETLLSLSYLPQESENHQRLVAVATQKMNTLLEVMNKDLVNCQKITLDNHQYFELATDTLSSMNKLFEHQVKQLSRIL